MATANDVLKIAKAELGTKENPANSNKVKYNTWYYGRVVSGPDYPWCMVFVQWIFNQAGVNLGLKTASCTALMNHTKKQKRFVTSGFKPGDILFYQFDSDSAADHTGICESATSTTVTAIEGNTSVNGSQSNGGAVCRQTRKRSCVLGAYRPIFSNPVTVTLEILRIGSTGDSVEALQILLNGLGYNCGKVDGDFGSNTEKAVKNFQKANQLTQDGVVGANTWKALLT